MKRIIKCSACMAIIFAIGCSGSTGSDGTKDIITNYQSGLAPKNIGGTYELTGEIKNNTCSNDIVLDPSRPIVISLSQSGSMVALSENSDTHSSTTLTTLAGSTSSGSTALAESTPSLTTGSTSSGSTALAESTPSPTTGSTSSGSTALAESTPSLTKFTKATNTGEVSGGSFKIETSSPQTYKGCSYISNTVLVCTIDDNGNISGAIEGTVTNVSGDCASIGVQECSALLSLAGEKASSSSSGSSETSTMSGSDQVSPTDDNASGGAASSGSTTSN